MKTSNPLIDNLIEAQTQSFNNWMETTKKFQNAFVQGSIGTEGQNIYKNWIDSQMNIYSGMQDTVQNAGEGFNGTNPQEFFKNWYNQQMNQVKNMGDFTQSLFNTYNNFGKPAADYMNNFNNMNNTWTSIYNNWMNVLNNSYDTFQKYINNPTNKDAFKNLFETNKVYAQLKDFWEPAFKAFQNGQFNAESFKQYFNPEAYRNVTQQLFGNAFTNQHIQEVFDNSIKNIHNYFVNNNNLYKEYNAQMENISKQFPNLVSGDFAKLSELFRNSGNVFNKTFEPLLKLVAPGKEKEAIENNIELMDKVAEFYVRQAQLQHQVYATAQTALEKAAKEAFEKFSANSTQNVSFNDFYNEWIKSNENLFTDLFASEEFSKVKAEVINLSMDVKKHFEKQFENVFNVYPLVYRSEMDELYKTVYDLKKQIKDLQAKLALSGHSIEEEEEKTAKAGARKK